MVDVVVITASAGSFPGLAGVLGKTSVVLEERPLMTFAPPADWAPLDTALGRLDQYGSVALTSPRAAAAVAERLKQREIAWQSGSGGTVLWASGPATAAALGGLMGPVRLPPGPRIARLGAAQALGRAMLQEKAVGPVLFPCGEAHRDELPLELQGGGLVVEEVICYRSVLATLTDARVAAERGSVLVVASPRVAELVARACPRTIRPALLAVGPTTAASARAAGWFPAAVAAEPTARAVATAVRSLLARR
jgi:uroporphyrinogen-III synthase